MIVLPPGGPVRIGSEVVIHGLRCIVETPKYTKRIGRNWINISPAHYGYISGYRGADGDEIDCYIGPATFSKLVFVVDQNRMDASGVFDEHKIMLNYSSKNEVLHDYLNGHHFGNRIFRAITSLTIPQLKFWLKNGNLTKPISNLGVNSWQSKAVGVF